MLHVCQQRVLFLPQATCHDIRSVDVRMGGPMGQLPSPAQLQQMAPEQCPGGWQRLPLAGEASTNPWVLMGKPWENHGTMVVLW